MRKSWHMKSSRGRLYLRSRKNSVLWLTGSQNALVSTSKASLKFWNLWRKSARGITSLSRNFHPAKIVSDPCSSHQEPRRWARIRIWQRLSNSSTSWKQAYKRHERNSYLASFKSVIKKLRLPIWKPDWTYRAAKWIRFWRRGASLRKVLTICDLSLKCFSQKSLN